ncbi:MAG TPA: class I SAM-dependent methyltransferase [Nocardioides sp.]|nr:class I SAM-dependent methyltransferase [Nocardioides sp.]
MQRHDLLKRLHELLEPRTYFEIGVSTGASMSRSRARSIGVDPAFHVKRELLCDLHLVRATSDEFFAREHPLAHFDEPLIDLAFIDGMHLAEYALRDFINTERFTHAASVIVIDDMLPRNVAEADRDRGRPRPNPAWAGDVYKILEPLRTQRPDLVLLEVDTLPTGTVVVLMPDPASTTLLSTYDDQVEAFVVPDPQDVPHEILTRSRAIAPQALLAAPIWDDLRRLRDVEDSQARPEVATLLADAGLATVR